MIAVTAILRVVMVINIYPACFFDLKPCADFRSISCPFCSMFCSKRVWSIQPCCWRGLRFVKNSITVCNNVEDNGNLLLKPSIFMTGSYLWIHAHHFWVSPMRFASNKQTEQWKIPFIDDLLWLSNGTWRFCIAMFSHLSHRRNSQPTTALSSGLAANTCQVLDLPNHLVPEDSHLSAVHGILCGKKPSPSPCFPALSLNVVFFLVVRNHKPIGFKSQASIQLGYSPKNHVPKMDPATDGNTPAFFRESGKIHGNH